MNKKEYDAISEYRVLDQQMRSKDVVDASAPADNYAANYDAAMDQSVSMKVQSRKKYRNSEGVIVWTPWIDQ